MPLASQKRVGGSPDSVAIRSRFGRDCVAKTRLHFIVSVAIGRDWSYFGEDKTQKKPNAGINSGIRLRVSLFVG